MSYRLLYPPGMCFKRKMMFSLDVCQQNLLYGKRSKDSWRVEPSLGSSREKNVMDAASTCPVIYSVDWKRNHFSRVILDLVLFGKCAITMR